ncbi:MAG TPA: bacteriohopanetetrol glucosamine biosynthesis glycosyltransferase HpnI [Candidatus Elarobacter sp.]|jgi:ceramide glucosyltransferase
MRADLRGAAAALTFAAAAASVAYTAFAIARVAAFGVRLARVRRRGRRLDRFGASSRRPSITVLKPVRGIEPALEQNLRSFCDQRYPSFDVVLGVLDPADAALPLLRRVAAEFPDRTTVVAADGVARCRNPKIATLLPLIEHAKGELLVVSDSDMRVTPDYLDAIADAFDDPRAGAATALYRGEPVDAGVASALGAMWITEQFAPSVLVANALEPLRYCFGSTMAVRSTVLEAIGGLRALGDHLADDHRLGRLVTERGWVVRLVPYVVANTVREPHLRALFAHERRWARTIRTTRPASYTGILLTYPLALALAHFALARDKRRARAVFTAAFGLRMVLHTLAQAVFATPRRRLDWLVLPRDVFGVAVWAAGLFGGGVRWRGDELRVGADGRLAATED